MNDTMTDRLHSSISNDLRVSPLVAEYIDSFLRMRAANEDESTYSIRISHLKQVWDRMSNEERAVASAIIIEKVLG